MLILVECFDKKERKYLPHILVRVAGIDKDSLTKTKTFIGKNSEFDYENVKVSALLFETKEKEDEYLEKIFQEITPQDLE